MLGFLGLVLVFGMVPLAVQGSSATRVVYPSGDTTGAEDAANIQAVFDALESGTVKLAKGDFYLADSIAISEFQGTLKGRGSGMTVVHIVTALSPVLEFDIGYDMSLRIAKLVFVADSTGSTAIEVRSETGPMSGKLSVRDCEFFDVEVGIVTYDHTSSDIEVVHNDFYNVGQAIYLAGPYEDCDISVSHNTIDVARHGVEVYDVDGSNVRIYCNKMTGIYDSQETYQTGAAIMIAQWSRFGAAGHVSVLFNDIQGYTRWDMGYDMVNILDFGPLFTGAYGNLESVIAFNRIVLDNSLWGGVGVHGGFSDTLIACNDVSGSGDAAIYVAFWSLWGLEAQTGVRVILNDVSGFEAVPVPGWIDPTAPIWLGPGVSDSLVVAMGDTSTVLDMSGSNTVVFIGA